MLFQSAWIPESLLLSLTIGVALQTCDATYVTVNPSNRLAESTWSAEVSQSTAHLPVMMNAWNIDTTLLESLYLHQLAARTERFIA